MQRIQYIDLAKGFCIILVVLHHVCVHCKYMPEGITIISTFRMPLYFFLSGLFFKEYEGAFGFLIRKINKLLVPFLFFYLITSVLLPNILYLCGFTVSHTESIGFSSIWAFLVKENFANNPIWFLWCLFIMNVIFYLLFLLVNKYLFVKYKVFKVFLLGLLCFGGGILSAYWSINRINVYGYVDSAMSALPFFCVGYILRAYTNFLNNKVLKKYLLLLVLICFVGVLALGGACLYMSNVFYINPVNRYLGGFMGILGIIYLSMIIERLPYISYWGRYSIMILVTHALLLQIYVPIIKKMGLPISIQITVLLVIVLFSYQFIIPLMRRFLPYVTAQKDLINGSKNIMCTSDAKEEK